MRAVGTTESSLNDFPDLDHRKPLHSVRFDRFFEEEPESAFISLKTAVRLSPFSFASGKMEPAQGRGAALLSERIGPGLVAAFWGADAARRKRQ